MTHGEQEQMAIVYDKLLALKIPNVERTYTQRDPIFYALSLGLGQDPVNADELPFVYEQGVKVLPTFPAVVAHPGMWARELDTGIDWVKIVHGEHDMVLHKPMPSAGSVVGEIRIVEAIDKGPGKGALIISQRKLRDKVTNELYATIKQTTFARGDGGFGGPQRPSPAPHTLPERAPDLTCDLATRPEMALIYRWNADMNPLHADPAVATKAGFPRPILHGLATFGVAGHAILKTMCGYDPARLKAIAGRFSSPVYPGETIRTEMWRDDGVVSFRARVVERDIVALNNGRAEITN
jgi:acyl dehydratase